MATNISKGDHRYIGGDISQPITITMVWEGAVQYIEGHHTIKHLKLDEFLTLPGDMPGAGALKGIFKR